jgi:hypothetical protein
MLSYCPESVDVSVNRLEYSDLVETALDEFAEILTERRGQPRIEATGRDRLVSRRIIASSEASECSAFTCGDAEQEPPHEHWKLKLALSLNHAEFPEVLCEELRWEKA